ncbi:PilZ domain-containing protein [Oceanidesulfovibrio marinus]|uniref:PilZ domain-containing protein n=1 Tax=Oceanidesulfovibrio marinus TaxID=370038 RepID=A0ABX6NLM9_9BACT|nr:PilZ domain-containing protein [Oceanidesulfovibrio marinus]QJT10585.1 PilZ domain-containing protein [Oceanidesulfovibrio marinus]
MQRNADGAYVFYSEDGQTVSIQCAECRYSRTVPIESLRDLGRFFTVGCRCGERFTATVEFRRHFRKKVDLDGTYRNPETGEDDDIVVEDLSQSGIRFATVAPHSLQPGMVVKVRFTLDTPKRPVKQRTVEVRKTEGLHVSGRFVGAPERDSDIGFYLMP